MVVAYAVAPVLLFATFWLLVFALGFTDHLRVTCGPARCTVEQGGAFGLSRVGSYPLGALQQVYEPCRRSEMDTTSSSICDVAFVVSSWTPAGGTADESPDRTGVVVYGNIGSGWHGAADIEAMQFAGGRYDFLGHLLPWPPALTTVLAAAAALALAAVVRHGYRRGVYRQARPSTAVSA